MPPKGQFEQVGKYNEDVKLRVCQEQRCSAWSLVCKAVMLPFPPASQAHGRNKVTWLSDAGE